MEKSKKFFFTQILIPNPSNMLGRICPLISSVSEHNFLGKNHFFHIFFNKKNVKFAKNGALKNGP